jgi:hypothetical protein
MDSEGSPECGVECRDEVESSMGVYDGGEIYKHATHAYTHEHTHA